MKKAQQLREHLALHVPALKSDPEALHVFIEKGALACRLGSLSFEYRYDLNLIITDYAEHADTVMVPLLAWIAVNEPNLMQNPGTLEEVLRFEAEIIDHDKADLSITLPIRERVVVSKTLSGYNAQHFPEPPLPDLGGTPGWELFLNGDPVAPGP